MALGWQTVFIALGGSVAVTAIAFLALVVYEQTRQR